MIQDQPGGQIDRQEGNADDQGTCPIEGSISCGVEQKIPLLDRQLLDACIHCGLCLPACPTYLATGREMESPRGRIYLMNLWASNREKLSKRLAEHIESCLGCLGCQTACPSGVAYEKILNQARPHLGQFKDWHTRKLMRFVFSTILPDYKKLRWFGSLLYRWQQSGAKTTFKSMPYLSKVLAPISDWLRFLPALPKHQRLPRQSWASGEKQGVVQLFSGCVMDIFYNQVNHACLQLLTKQKCIVEVGEQTCCGALAFHAGELDIARILAKQNIELFAKSEGSIVATAAGCGAMLKGYGDLLESDESFAQKAKAFSARVLDITQSLAAGQFDGKGKRMEKKVAYHAACHLAHAQKVRQSPEVLLSALDGLSLIPLPEAEHCCGSAGIFNLTHTELSLKILERKVSQIISTGAEMIVTTNPGCLLQLESGLRFVGSTIVVKHLAELLYEAYCIN